MLHHGAEKSIPLSFIYPEFAARGFDSKEEFVEHLLARQQEIHELVRRNTHQAQLRQKLKFDRHLKAKTHAVGDAVWVFCHIIPKGGTRKLIRAWRGPHMVTNVLQDGRLYVLDTALLCICKLNRYRHISVRVGPPIPQTCLKACKIGNLALILRNPRHSFSFFGIRGHGLIR